MLISVIAGFLIRAIAKGPLKGGQTEPPSDDPVQGAQVMKPSSVHHALAVCVGVLFGMMSAIFFYGSWPLVGATFAAIAGTSVYSLRRRVMLSGEGLTSFSPWTGTFEARWPDIQKVRFRQWGQTIRIRVDGRERIVIPCTLAGMTQLEELMSAHLAPEVLGDTFAAYKQYVRQL